MKSCIRCGNKLKLGKKYCSYKCIHPSFEERFWSKVNIKDKLSCWNWIGKSVTEFGYGRFNIGGKIEKAPRVAFMLVKGNIPEGKHILHKCDNPKCVNPKHLYLGGNKENARDRVLRNRTLIGENNPLAKFSKELIEIIRKEIKKGTVITKDISNKYNVSQRHIRDIINFKTRIRE